MIPPWKEEERQEKKILGKFIFPETCKAERIGYISGEIPCFSNFISARGASS